MVGDWVITKPVGHYKTESTWTITKDRIHRHSNIAGWQIQWYHRLDAGKDPRQIDIAAQLNGPPIIKGIYVLDGDELRLCLGELGKDRPAAFPKEPKPGEVLILQRAKEAAEPPKAAAAERGAAPAAGAPAAPPAGEPAAPAPPATERKRD
jgi:uncharacterized protein (TIGR03067 family)